jgi:hypothetical protein
MVVLNGTSRACVISNLAMSNAFARRELKLDNPTATQP